MSRDDVRVPVKAWLRGPTFLSLERAAAERRTTVGDLLSVLADRAIEKRPAGRVYVRVTDEMRSAIAELHAQGLGTTAIARRVGCSVASVYNHLPSKEQQ
jgi:DNA invertase Pin-like site-specific DNA recombinase